MKVEFLRDTDPKKEGGKDFKKGDVVEMSNSSMRHWQARGAVRVKGEHERRAPALKPAEREQVVNEMDKQISEIASAQPATDTKSTVGDATADSGGVGNGAVADAPASGRGKGGGRSGNSGQ